MIKIGSQFRLFRKGRIYKVTAVSNGKVKFEAVEGLQVTGSFPLSQASEHFRSNRR